jgi:hypothetical protein
MQQPALDIFVDTLHKNSLKAECAAHSTQAVHRVELVAIICHPIFTAKISHITGRRYIF